MRIVRNIVAAISASCLMVAQTASAISYSYKSPTRVEIEIHASEYMTAQPAIEEIVAKLLEAYRYAEEREVYAYQFGDDISASVADDERILHELEAELAFWNSMDSIAKTLGVGALGGVAVYITNQLKQLNGLAPARLAAIVTTCAAVAAEGASQMIAEQKKSIEARMKALREDVKSEIKYLQWQADYGGYGQPPSGGLECIIKESCRDTRVCVTNFGGSRDCTDKPVCTAEILTCK